MRSSRAPRRNLRRKVLRCPACGQRLDEPDAPSCSLCGFAFADERITNADMTPYARSYSLGRPGWRTMSEWIWFSSAERIKHIALMRSSAASRRYARLNLALLVLGLGIVLCTQIGWRWVTNAPELHGGSLIPSGPGWLHVASAPRPLPANHLAEIPVDLWWSAPQAGIAFASGVIAAAFLAWLSMALIRSGATAALPGPLRGERRMTAALHYGTAWAMPVFVGTLVAGLLPFSYIGDIADWRWYPPEEGFKLAAGVVAGLGVCLWWFYLVRLGAAAPPHLRGKVTAFFGFVAPLIVAGCGAAWYFGLMLLNKVLLEALDLGF